MEKQYAKGIILLETIINEINSDLAQNNKYNLEHLILFASSYISKDISIEKAKLPDVILSKVSEYLLQNSESYRELYNDSEQFLLFSNFIKFLLLKYDRMMITEKQIFDYNVHVSSGNEVKGELKNLGVKKENINSVQYTIELLNEAIRIYFELYDKRTLIAFFSNDDIIKFRLEETTLAHILGVNLVKIVSNDKLADLFKITDYEKEAILNNYPGSAKIDVLLKIVDMSSGNFLSYEEDRLRRIKLDRVQKFISNQEYSMGDYQKTEKTSPINYGKVNMRSKAFIDFKPLDEITLSIKFPKGYKLIRSGPDDVNHSILISKNNLSEIFKYSTFITDYSEPESRRYFKSLEAKTIDDVALWKKDGEIATATKVISDPDSGVGGGSGGTYVTIFSEQKQKQFIEEFLQDFYNMDDFENLEEIKNYVDNLGGKTRTK